MQPLSARAQELISALQHRPGFADRLFRGSDEDVRILDELASRAELVVVRHVLGLAFAGTPPVRRAAARLIDRAVRAATATELLELDEICRASGWPYDVRTSDAWRGLRPVELMRLGGPGDDASSVMGVASCHPDGYVREAAVTSLDQLTDASALPFLLIRCHDWVNPVAIRARDAVERRLTSGFAAAWVHCIPLLLRLRARRRGGEGDLLARVSALLAEPAARPELERALTSSLRDVRRLAFRVAFERSDLERATLFRRAMEEPDTVVRVHAVEEGRRGIAAEELAATLPRLLRDPFPVVRRQALHVAVELLGERAQVHLEAAMLDRNRTVREVARFFLRRLGPVDVAAFYRAAVERPASDARAATLAAAIAGLGEVREEGAGPIQPEPVDVALVERHLEHPLPAVRRAAVHALARLDPGNAPERLVPMLLDDSARVSHAARVALRAHAREVGLARLRHVISSARRAHGRMDAFLLGGALGKWERLQLLLDAAADHDLSIREAAGQRLVRWIENQNREFTPASFAEIAAIESTLEANASRIEPRIAAELRAIVRFWKA